MTQLDRIEAMLTELVEIAKRDSLGAQMREAVAAVNEIKAAQMIPDIPDDPGVSREPVVDVPTAKDGKPLKFKQPATEADHRPDQTGGVPAVHAGKKDPASPANWAGVPRWEKGREPVTIVPGRGG